MKKIPLTKGKFAIVDDEDYPYLNRFSWHWDIDIVATTFHDLDGKDKHVPMYRFLITTNPVNFIFFKNGNKLDHRKQNLGEQNRNLNVHRRIKYKNCSSKYKGVSKMKAGGYMAYINTKKIRLYIGYFVDEKEAALAYNRKAKKYYGNLAYQNIIK